MIDLQILHHGVEHPAVIDREASHEGKNRNNVPKSSAASNIKLLISFISSFDPPGSLGIGLLALRKILLPFK